MVICDSRFSDISFIIYLIIYLMPVYTYSYIVDIQWIPGGGVDKMIKKFSLIVFLHEQIT